MSTRRAKGPGLFSDPARAGVYRMPEPADPPEASRGAGPLAVWRVPLDGVQEKGQFLAAIAHALRFPDWFGDNWDALKDCLTDLTWRKAPGYMIILEECQAFARAAPADFETALELFRLVADDWRESHVPFWVLVQGPAAGEFDLPDLPRA
jgi:RNAse (barnase) inhibitor barstar